jgi:hypothetical protein
MAEAGISAGASRSVSSVNLTSAEVNGVPSAHSTPSRSLMVELMKSGAFS